MSKKPIRCAIYTRKSSEEGLEQEFNSLHAQREACEAYIKSQQHEGWTCLPTLYDDGGFSGGNMERPAFKKLMQDIEDQKIDIIIVYKVDRLTRSLMDFSKIIETLDNHETSFVSVTQQFNTTNSMGRLTLNVLLSFAQFEREVTGERIRDKIAASKKKGMWMGGVPPLGYDVKERKLVINTKESDLIRRIFDEYLTLKSVHLLKEKLDQRGDLTKTGKTFSKGHLYRILQRRTYIGEVTHKDQSYPGEHKGIVDLKIFEKAQNCLAENRRKRKNGIGKKYPSLLIGKLFDDRGNYMSPTHSQTRKRHYRYYMSQAVIKANHDQAGSISKLPADEIEKLVENETVRYLKSKVKLSPYLKGFSVEKQKEIFERVKSFFKSWKEETVDRRYALVRNILKKATVYKDSVTLELHKEQILPMIEHLAYGHSLPEVKEEGGVIEIQKAIQLARVKDGSKLIIGAEEGQKRNPQLIKAITRSYLWHEMLLNGEVKSMKEIKEKEGITANQYFEDVMSLRFLSPQIVAAILEGTLPREITVEKLFAIQSSDWKDQHAQFGL
ncbi:MAG: recombinase family protein [Alphaproteobacteria bacterium]